MLSHEEARFSPHGTANEAKNVHAQCCFGNRRMSNRGVDVLVMPALDKLVLGSCDVFIPLTNLGALPG
jgi:hypothetical protein